MPLPVPDLLAVDAAVRVDLASMRHTLSFAFTAGGTLDGFDDAISGAKLPASAWDRAAFERDLYLDEVIDRVLPVVVGDRTHPGCRRYLRRAVGEPPRDARVTAFRRGVLAELAASSELRAALEGAYTRIVGIRSLLCAARQPAPRVRRVECLRAVRDAFEWLATSFDAATSGLARLRDFATAARATDAHRRLAALVEHEDRLATVDARVTIGADGEVRSLAIVSVRENRESPWHRSSIARFLVRLFFFFLGYRASSSEIADRVLDETFAGVQDDVALLFQLLGDMEPYLASLALRDRARARGLETCLADMGDVGCGIDLRALFNPLLLAAGVDPVPCDVRAEAGATTLVTGPNSGGKTRLLQAIAIAQLFAQAGLFVPARAARLGRAAGLFASLFEEASADQREGHLGMEMMRIRRMFESLEPGSLVVVDELCSGTNPSEGEEIARVVLALLPQLGAQAFVTTHLLAFARTLQEERSVERLAFLQVELDAHHRPTFGFVPGVATTSRALATAARLGVTRDELEALVEAKKRKRAAE